VAVAVPLERGMTSIRCHSGIGRLIAWMVDPSSFWIGMAHRLYGWPLKKVLLRSSTSSSGTA